MYIVHTMLCGDIRATDGMLLSGIGFPPIHEQEGATHVPHGTRVALCLSSNPLLHLREHVGKDPILGQEPIELRRRGLLTSFERHKHLQVGSTLVQSAAY